jgi:D-sedoheptulose 7-phosphate isomerase
VTEQAFFAGYAQRLQKAMAEAPWQPIETLARELLDCWKTGRQVFMCGNGGSAGNAMHLANDLLYGISKKYGSGLRVNALPSNASVLTCLGNDCGYDQIFAMQLAVQASRGDVLVVLSGSGNSPNIVKVLEQAKKWACAATRCSATPAARRRRSPTCRSTSRSTTCRSPRTCSSSPAT